MSDNPDMSLRQRNPTTSSTSLGGSTSSSSNSNSKPREESAMNVFAGKNTANGNDPSLDKHDDEEEAANPHPANNKDPHGGDGDDEEELVQEEGLPPNIFSVLYVSDVNSPAFNYATILVCGQLAIVITALLDSFSKGSSNPANIPAGVPATVTVAQAAIIPLAVASQNDFILAAVRFNDRIYENIDVTWYNTTFVKWLVSALSQLFVGLGILTTIFVFTMQSESVFQVLVNFVALFAVSNVSLVGFNMALRGFVGRAILRDAMKVTRYVVKRKFKPGRLLQVMYLTVLLALYIAFGVVVHRQRSGHFLCHSIFVQFDDQFQLTLPYLSGIYTITDKRVHERFQYVDDVTGTDLTMAYCEEKESWGISSYTLNDPCAYYVLSQETDSFDVETTAATPWRVLTERDQSLVDAGSFELQCLDCDTDSCHPNRGQCVDNTCKCLNGRYGMHCEFRAPCEKLVLSEARDGFPPIPSMINQDYVFLDSAYELLKQNKTGDVAFSYHRPVYCSPGCRYVLFFTGRRWSIVNPSLAWLGDDEELDGLPERLFLVFATQHMYTALNHPLLQRFAVSEEVESGSPVDTGLPVGLHWIGTRVFRTGRRTTMALDLSEKFDAIFLCAHCEEGVNDCEHFGHCDNATKTCQCTTGLLDFPIYTGALCERALTCSDAKKDYGDILPTGCHGDFQCVNDRCTCLDDYPDAGNLCQNMRCYSDYMRDTIFPPNGCANNGICSNRTGACRCEADMFEGRYCQIKVAACYEDSARFRFPPYGCDNDGICNTTTGFCKCVGDAADDFEGRYCHRLKPPCHFNIMRETYPPLGCSNGGTCSNSTGSCTCPSNESIIYEGKYCERNQNRNRTIEDDFSTRKKKY